MHIDFHGPVYAVDRYAIRAFAEIVNLIIVSNNPADLNLGLHRINCNPAYRSLWGYFKWEFTDDSFTLRQRIDYCATALFDDMVFTVRYRSFISPKYEPKNGRS